MLPYSIDIRDIKHKLEDGGLNDTKEGPVRSQFRTSHIPRESVAAISNLVNVAERRTQIKQFYETTNHQAGDETYTPTPRKFPTIRGPSTRPQSPKKPITFATCRNTPTTNRNIPNSQNVATPAKNPMTMSDPIQFQKRPQIQMPTKRASSNMNQVQNSRLPAKTTNSSNSIPRRAAPSRPARPPKETLNIQEEPKTTPIPDEIDTPIKTEDITNTKVDVNIETSLNTSNTELNTNNDTNSNSNKKPSFNLSKSQNDIGPPKVTNNNNLFNSNDSIKEIVNDPVEEVKSDNKKDISRYFPYEEPGFLEAIGLREVTLSIFIPEFLIRKTIRLPLNNLISDVIELASRNVNTTKRFSLYLPRSGIYLPNERPLFSFQLIHKDQLELVSRICSVAVGF